MSAFRKRHVWRRFSLLLWFFSYFKFFFSFCSFFLSPLTIKDSVSCEMQRCGIYELFIVVTKFIREETDKKKMARWKSDRKFSWMKREEGETETEEHLDFLERYTDRGWISCNWICFILSGSEIFRVVLVVKTVTLSFRLPLRKQFWRFFPRFGFIFLPIGPVGRSHLPADTIRSLFPNDVYLESLWVTFVSQSALLCYFIF